MSIENFMLNKKVLMIPVYSSRSYDTGVYNLATDGNMSKYMMKILKAKPKEVTILIPENSVGISFVENVIKRYVKYKVNIVKFMYGKNAMENRNMGHKFYEFINNSDEYFDIIISEVNTLAEIVAVKNSKKLSTDNFLYWVGTHNKNGTLWCDFLDDNIKIAKVVNTACLIKGQAELFGGKSFHDVYLYEPKYFEKTIIFFPFRLTDKSYKADFLVDTIMRLLTDGINNFVVLYTDPNESHIFDGLENFSKTTYEKNTYNAILKGKPIIPFFDDMTKNSHSNIFEFKYYGCDILTNTDTFYEDLKRRLGA